MAQVQVITGPTRYRSWSEDQKRALVLAAFAPGATVTDVARQADVSASLLYRWRRDFRGADEGFAKVVVAQTASGVSDTAAAIEIEFAGRARIRIPSATPPALAVAVVTALSGPVRRSPTGEGG